MKLAEALLRRKELADKVKLLGQYKESPNLFESKVIRKNITEALDEYSIRGARLSITEVTAAYDHYARQLRVVDAAIQRANWDTELPTLSVDVMTDFVPPSAS